MVHALQESHRILQPGAVMIDLRPITEEWPIEVVTRRQNRLVGRVAPLPDDLEVDAAAARSFQHAAETGLFDRKGEAAFNYDYSWDSPSEMKEYIETEWDDWVTISKATWSQIRSAWAVADADAMLRVAVKMQITRWMRGT